MKINNLTNSQESLLNEILEKQLNFPTVEKEIKHKNTLEDDINSLLFKNEENSFSSEVYFGIKNPFSKEMINYSKLLIDEVRRLTNNDENNTKNLEDAVKEENKNSILLSILDNMGNCISRHCNIEKCYIGLIYGYDAYTLPLTIDSSIFIDDFEKAARSFKYGRFTINGRYIKPNEEIEKQLLKFDDIILNNNGYKFKSAEGKVFIINVGIHFIMDKTIEITPEMLCAIIFHEIGHNFEQILRSTNQTLIDIYIKFKLFQLENSNTTGLLTLISDLFLNSSIGKTLLSTKDKIQKYNIIKEILMCGIYIGEDGKIMSRKEIGDVERAYIEETIELAKQKQKFSAFVLFIKILFYIVNTINRTASLTVGLLDTAFNSIRRNKMQLRYETVINEVKSYEQFADNFAVAYGFGQDMSSFITKIQKIASNPSNKILDKYPSFLNHIPVLSKILLLNELNNEKFNTNLVGYDALYERVAAIYVSLDYELKNNKKLSNKDKQDIIKQMEVSKSQFQLVKEIEVGGITKNKSLTKWLLNKARSGDISEVGIKTGVIEYVLKLVEEFENKKPTTVNNEDVKITEISKKLDTIINEEDKK